MRGIFNTYYTFAILISIVAFIVNIVMVFAPVQIAKSLKDNKKEKKWVE